MSDSASAASEAARARSESISVRRDIPLPPLSLQAAPVSELKQSLLPRQASAPSLNATQSQAATPQPASALGRSGTLKATSKPSQSSRSAKAPPAQYVRKPSDTGYDGGVERHGQANDFEDIDSDSDAAPATPAAETPSSEPRNGTTPTGAGQKGKGDTYFGASTSKNRNPSVSAHQHGRLPHHRTSSYIGSRQRSNSNASTRSTDASNHPFPHLGMKRNKSTDGSEHVQPEQWKSVEEKRLDQDEKKEHHWKRWGPYLSERQWVSRQTSTSFLRARVLM